MLTPAHLSEPIITAAEAHPVAEYHARNAAERGIDDIERVKKGRNKNSPSQRDTLGSTYALSASSSQHVLAHPRKEHEACAAEESQSQEVLMVAQFCGASLPACIASLHLCPFDENRGCASCHRVCHANCDSDLCEFIPCGFCSSLSLITHENSILCIAAQTDSIGCHACGQDSCWSSSPACHTKCSRGNHVCQPNYDSTKGCTNCGMLCHVNNTDLRCEFFQRMRGHICWTANAQQLMDTQAGTDGALPHYSQVEWHFEGRTDRGSRKVVVDGISYFVGRGDPGRAVDSEYNNCLIDSLRQRLGLIADRTTVRSDLISEFANEVGRAKVTQSSFLDVEIHGRAILRSLFRHNSSGQTSSYESRIYCIIALYANNVGHGVVVGDRTAPLRLVVLNDSDTHFDPCMPL